MKNCKVMFIALSLSLVLATLSSIARAQEFVGRWSQQASNTAGMATIRVLTSGTDIKFANACRTGWRKIPDGVFFVKGNRLTLGNQKFALNIGGKCGKAAVKASQTEGQIHLKIHRIQRNDDFVVTVNR